MKTTMMIALAAAGLMTATTANAAPIFSENFESGFGSFTASGNVANANGADYQACCGTTGNLTNHFAAFGGGNMASGLLSGTFATVLGQLYSVSFDFGALGGGSEPLTFTTGATSYTLNPTANNNLDATFQAGSFTFVGTGGATSLAITSGGINNVDAILDNVSIAAVPEPATWAMMLLGFGMMGASIRYRRRDTKVAYA